VSQTTASKTNPGHFFEDFSLGQVLRHATPRTITEGDRALYGALYPSRFALPSSAAFAASVGLGAAGRHPVEELIAFHVAFGKTVPDISLNAVANLGYAECRFHRPVVPGDTLSTSSEVIGLKQNSNGRSGVVYVRSTAVDQHGEVVLEWVRWVMVHKRSADAPAPATVLPELAPAVAASDLVVPDGLDFTGYDLVAAGEPHRLGDYAVGERIDHVDGVTLTDAEHMMATRLWQNTAKVHFNTEARPDGRRLVYGGHVISLARALSFNGLANAQPIAAINAGSHVAPAFAGDTVHAWSEVLDTAATTAPGVGAIRLRLVATRGRQEAMTLRRAEGEGAGGYADGVLLDLDYWAFMPL
jgi:2-methylfumaryl-CoA hydratase